MQYACTFFHIGWISAKFEFLTCQGIVATRLKWGGRCHGFVANFIRFLAVQTFWKSVKIWQSYREFKGWNFFETQCRLFGVDLLNALCEPGQTTAAVSITSTSTSLMLDGGVMTSHDDVTFEWRVGEWHFAAETWSNTSSSSSLSCRHWSLTTMSPGISVIQFHVIYDVSWFSRAESKRDELAKSQLPRLS